MKHRRVPRITPEATKEVLRLHSMGLSSRKIAASTGVSRSSVATIVENPHAVADAERREARSRIPAWKKTSLFKDYQARYPGEKQLCTSCGFRVPLPCVYCQGRQAFELGWDCDVEDDEGPQLGDPTPEEIEAFMRAKLESRPVTEDFE